MTRVTDIEGIDAPLAYLGVAREIVYGALKGDDGWQEYIHKFGEDSGNYPCVYALGDKAIVIAGASFRVEGRGLVD